MAEITGHTRIRDLLRSHPETKKILSRHGMRCTTCKGSDHETLRHAAVNHGVPLQKLLDELRAAHKSGDEG